jgi:hypothetical protein
MNTHSTLDRESFQEVLANAFAVQKSQMDTQSLSDIVQVQRSITSSNLDTDIAMRLIADRTRNVANATGVAIGLINGDQLVYRAGSGSAAAYTGRQVIATLSVPANTETRQEILRVENAQTDKRMEAAICRQFGATSLLILLVYHHHAVAGVLEIFFDKAHVFQDREVRIYRLMAGLVGEALSHAARDGQKKALAAEPSTVPHVIEQTALQTRKGPSPGRSAEETPNKHAIDQACGADIAAGKLPAPEQPAEAATISSTQQETGGPLVKPRRNGTVAAVVTVLGIACWIAYSSNLPRITSERLRRAFSTVPAERRVTAVPVTNEVLKGGRLTGDALPFAPTRDSLSASNRPAIPSAIQGDQSQRSFEKSQSATVQPFDVQASQSQEAIQHDGKFAPGRTAAGTEPHKLQKPSPILSYRGVDETKGAALQRTGNGIHVSAKMGRKNGTAKARNVRAPVASIHHPSKVRTAEVKRGLARESAARAGPRSRMIAKNPKQASGPVAPERKMAKIGSEIGDNQPRHHQSGNEPEPSSPAEQLNELSRKGRPAAIGQSGWHYFGDVGRGRDRSASAAAQPQNRGFGPGDVTRSESRARTTNTFPRRDALSNHGEGWHRFTPQRRWTPPDESWRKRRPVEPDYSSNGSRAASQPSGG